MNFTKSPLKQRNVNISTNNKGQHYSNVRVPIKNYTTTSVAKRIDQNMSSLSVPTNIVNPSASHLKEPSDLVENNTNIVVNEKINVILGHIPGPAHPKTNLPNPFALQPKQLLVENKTSFAVNDKLNVAMGHIPVQTTDLEYTKQQQFVHILKLLHLKTPVIENVYQEKYNYNVNASGLGDFIRGSYFLMEFCDNHKIRYNINILNHPVSQFLETYKNQQPLIYNNVNRFEQRNFNPFVSDNSIISNIYDPSINHSFICYLGKQHIFQKKLYIYTITYPSNKISKKHKEHMKRILTPSKSIALLVDHTLAELGLVKKQFTIIHIRYGDDFLIKNIKDIKTSHVKVLQNTFDKLDLTQTYLLISDNTIIKNLILSQYPFTKTHFNEISHTGEGLYLETHKLQNTMIDFNLFSHATKVIAFSTYKHGTGFSKWATETYSVPYSCRFLS
jgi:hypothetical protein